MSARVRGEFQRGRSSIAVAASIPVRGVTIPGLESAIHCIGGIDSISENQLLAISILGLLAVYDSNSGSVPIKKRNNTTSNPILFLLLLLFLVTAAPANTELDRAKNNTD